jgi:hypothetical protein
MPDVAAVEFLDIGFADIGDVVIEAFDGVPIFRGDASHVVLWIPCRNAPP